MSAKRDVFHAIADPTRRDILALLITEPQNINALADHFAMTRQAVSLHIKVLDECGVIHIRKEGRERFCELEAKKLKEVVKWMHPFRKLWEDRFKLLDELLETMKNDDNE